MAAAPNDATTTPRQVSCTPKPSGPQVTLAMGLSAHYPLFQQHLTAVSSEPTGL